MQAPSAGAGAGAGDEFSVTDYDTTSVSASTYDPAAARRRSAKVKAALAALPAPEYTYEVSIPKQKDADADAAGAGTNGGTSDSSATKPVRPDRELEAAANAAAAAAAQVAKDARRSTAVRLGLPIPPALTQEAREYLSAPAAHLLREVTKEANGEGSSSDEGSVSSAQQLVQASRMVGEEMVKLVAFDCYTHWSPDMARHSAVRPALEAEPVQEDDGLMEKARAAIREEAGKEACGPDDDAFKKVWTSLHAESFNAGNGNGNGSSCNKDKGTVQAAKAEFNALKKAITADSKVASTIEKHIRDSRQGLALRASQASAQLDSSYSKYADLCTEVNSLKKQKAQEERALNTRMVSVKTELQELVHREQQLQISYAELATRV